MTDLLDKLQHATEGSRELDLAIELFLEDGGYDCPASNWEKDAPHYTTNLQYAVSLKSEDCNLTIEIASHQNAAWLHRSGMSVCSDHGTMRPIALVVCTVIIKAHESKAVKLPEIRRIAEADDGALEGDL